MHKNAKPLSEFDQYVNAYADDAEGCLERFLTRLRREIAGDGPSCRPAGAVEAFDAACDRLGVPFLEP